MAKSTTSFGQKVHMLLPFPAVVKFFSI